MRAAPPFLIITTTKEVGQITESQVVECLDYYYYEDTSGGAYVRSLFGDNILGPDQFDSENFRTIPNVIARLLDEPVGLNDAYSISLPSGGKIFDQKTGNKNYITIPPDLLTEDHDKKLACLIFVFILFSIVGTKDTEDKYTSFDFSANIALRTDPPPPLNSYTSDVTSTNQETGETTTAPNLYNNQGFIDVTLPELKLMATAFYPEQPNDTRHSLYIFKHTSTEVAPFVSTDPNLNTPALFCIDLTKVNQDILSNTTNLRVNDANTTVESMLGYQKNGVAGYLMALITNKNVQETTVEQPSPV